MTFRLKAWHIFLIGLGVVYLITSILFEPRDTGAITAEYVFVGGIALVMYYVIFELPKRRKQKNPHDPLENTENHVPNRTQNTK